jgi:hypothetical protein
VDKHSWKKEALCLGYETDLFFDKYEEDESSRTEIDKLCSGCPVMRECFAAGVSQKEWGVWGGIYFEGGKISREFNSHKTKDDWSDTWENLTMDR